MYAAHFGGHDNVGATRAWQIMINLYRHRRAEVSAMPHPFRRYHQEGLGGAPGMFMGAGSIGWVVTTYCRRAS